MRIVGENPGMSFYVTGSDDEDGLIVDAEVDRGRVALQLPIQSLPWRDAARIAKYERPRRPYGCGDEVELLMTMRAVLKAEDVQLLTGVTGAARLTLEEGIATIELAKGAQLSAPCLRIVEAVRMPAVVRLLGVRRGAVRGELHVLQLSGGRRVGGATAVFGRGAVDRS
jgi:hypothetical protein